MNLNENISNLINNSNVDISVNSKTKMIYLLSWYIVMFVGFS